MGANQRLIAAMGRSYAPQDCRTISTGSICVDSMSSPSIRPTMVFTSPSPASRMFCWIVVSGGLT